MLPRTPGCNLTASYQKNTGSVGINYKEFFWKDSLNCPLFIVIKTVKTVRKESPQGILYTEKINDGVTLYPVNKLFYIEDYQLRIKSGNLNHKIANDEIHLYEDIIFSSIAEGAIYDNDGVLLHKSAPDASFNLEFSRIYLSTISDPIQSDYSLLELRSKLYDSYLSMLSDLQEGIWAEKEEREELQAALNKCKKDLKEVNTKLKKSRGQIEYYPYPYTTLFSWVYNKEKFLDITDLNNYDRKYLSKLIGKAKHQLDVILFKDIETDLSNYGKYYEGKLEIESVETTATHIKDYIYKAEKNTNATITFEENPISESMQLWLNIYAQLEIYCTNLRLHNYFFDWEGPASSLSSFRNKFINKKSITVILPKFAGLTQSFFQVINGLLILKKGFSGKVNERKEQTITVKLIHYDCFSSELIKTEKVFKL